MICYSNENNVHGMSVTDWVDQRDVASNTVDSISQCPSVMRMCAVHLSMCHRTISQATSTQVSTHYVTMSEVGCSSYQAQALGSLPTSFYYDRGVML